MEAPEGLHPPQPQYAIKASRHEEPPSPILAPIPWSPCQARDAPWVRQVSEVPGILSLYVLQGDHLREPVCTPCDGEQSVVLMKG
jgi:hypothetical protein